MYSAFVTRIKNLRKHSNADRLLCGECFGNTVIVGLDTQPDELGVYFPVDGKLGIEFAQKNDLLRRKDENGNPAGGYLDPEKRNIKALKLRGEKSDGLFMPLSSLAEFTDISQLKDGDTITQLNGVTICEKYVPVRKQSANVGAGNRTRKRKDPISPLFMEHADTEQLPYNLGAFHQGDLVEITLKMHGTSQRTGYLPMLSGYKRTLLDKLFRRPGTPIYDWGYVTGTRRVVLDTYDGGFYGSNAFRQQYHDMFKDKLPKGVEIFYEIVGWIDENKTIMGRCSNKLIKDKEFSKQYGDETVFSYGCEVGQSDCYVYRMTMTNPDGYAVELPWEQVQIECEKMGVKCVPTFERFVFTTWEDLMERVEKYYDGADPIGKNHVREGVVVRIDNRSKFTAYKHKNFSFKVLEGIIKDTADAPDMEEAEELVVNE